MFDRRILLKPQSKTELPSETQWSEDAALNPYISCPVDGHLLLLQPPAVPERPRQSVLQSLQPPPRTPCSMFCTKEHPTLSTTVSLLGLYTSVLHPCLPSWSPWFCMFYIFWGLFFALLPCPSGVILARPNWILLLRISDYVILAHAQQGFLPAAYYLTCRLSSQNFSIPFFCPKPKWPFCANPTGPKRLALGTSVT